MTTYKMISKRHKVSAERRETTAKTNKSTKNAGKCKTTKNSHEKTQTQRVTKPV